MACLLQSDTDKSEVRLTLIGALTYLRYSLSLLSTLETAEVASTGTERGGAKRCGEEYKYVNRPQPQKYNNIANHQT